MDIWEGIKKSPVSLKPNYVKIPVTNLGMSIESAKRWNDIYSYVKKELKGRKIIRTESGGIDRSSRFPCYDVRNTSSCLELTYLGERFNARIQFRSNLPYQGISGRTAFIKFREMLLEDGVDISKYALPYEKAVDTKLSIQQPPIFVCDDKMVDRELNGVCHIDFHSSFPSGLANTHEEFRPTIQRIYDKRHEDSGLYKAILNYSIGYMQSISGCKAKYSQLSKDAIEDNNNRLLDITRRLMENGRVPLLFNTDGVWYLGEPYHGEGEGENLGEWHNDHVNCRFRMKSAGCYEFIEDGIYCPVARGVKKEITDKWSWGGIYSQESSIIKYRFSEEKGIYYENVSL